MCPCRPQEAELSLGTAMHMNMHANVASAQEILALQRQIGGLHRRQSKEQSNHELYEESALYRECMLEVFVDEHLTSSASLFEVMLSPAFKNQKKLPACCVFAYHPAVMTSPRNHVSVLKLLQHGQQSSACRRALTGSS